MIEDTVSDFNCTDVPKTWKNLQDTKCHTIIVVCDDRLEDNQGRPIRLIVYKWYSPRKGWRYECEQVWSWAWMQNRKREMDK